ncbi:MAG: aminomethyl-transferring glycine dehydrogenase subunit GcvPA [Synergistaceae bacterium]|jgi:glycine dehydrogenase subunit 1|nr:aminomethyl-transferring glycine dehydrogenase subunit GcvPA [Synergistaceae bacterium]
MRYLSHTPDDIKEMLEAVGVKSVEELFSSIPAGVRRDSEIDIEPRSEWRLSRDFEEMAGGLTAAGPAVSFAGAGSYSHCVPAHIPYLASRSEFLTSYTPYQPEISQGTLQAIFEFQTMTAGLLGMEIANASMYDGASSLAEAVLMAIRTKKKPKVAVSRLNHPHYLQVLKTYLRPTAFEVVELEALPDGRTDYGATPDDVSALVVQSPNFLGCIEDLASAAETAHSKGALLVTSFTEAMAWGLLKNPGGQGADIVSGEGKSFGIPHSFGGPGVGMLACKKDFVRTIPGRLVGETIDKNGERSFVLTLAAREQHIRREKAVSNICTNSGHNALIAAIYMSTAGKEGLREIAQQNHDRAVYLKNGLEEAGFRPLFDSPFFNEFAMTAPAGFEKRHEALLARGFLAGLKLDLFPEYNDPRYKDAYLFCATEAHTRGVLDEFFAILKEVA